MIKRILTALAASIAVAAPASATPTEWTSYELIELVQNNGIAVTVNENCPVNVLGNYEWVGMKRSIHLCPGDEVDPIDHATLRHEVWHAIQHCVNTARGTHNNMPVASIADLNALVDEYLPDEVISYVKRNYNSSQWNIELEANLVEANYSPMELGEIFMQACTARTE